MIDVQSAERSHKERSVGRQRQACRGVVRQTSRFRSVGVVLQLVVMFAVTEQTVDRAHPDEVVVLQEVRDEP